ncbi:MAG: PAS domain S-box protein [Myxococcales bacterium]|nr:PAS domain S-box protein [Myxococcales bacterium]
MSASDDRDQTAMELGKAYQRIAELERQLARIQEEKRKYRMVTENATDIIWIVNLDLQFTFISAAVEKVRGFTVAEALQERLTDVLTPESYSLTLHHFQQELARDQDPDRPHGRNLMLELAQYRKDGSTIWTENTMKFIRDDANRPIGVIGVTRDISARMKTDKDLRESEERYRQLFESESDSIFLIDNETGRLLEANAAATAMYQMSREELLTKKNTDLSAEPEDTRRVTVSSPVISDQIITIPLRFHRKKDGTVFPVEITGRFFVRKGRPVHIAAIRDITERLRVEKENREWKRRYDLLFLSAGNIVYECNPQTGEAEWGGSIEAILGYAPAELTGGYHRWKELIHPNDREAIVRRYDESWERGTKFSAEYRCLRKNGHYVLLQDTGYPLLDEQGRPERILGVINDITDKKAAEENRRRLEEQLVQAQKMESIGRLAGGVAHDFNNILTGIIGYAEMMLTGMADDDRSFAEVTEIKKAAERAATLTAQLLAFSRKQLIDPKILDLNLLVGQSVRMIQRLIGEDIDLQFTAAPDLGRVKVDAGQIDQILINLAVNARDAMPRGGKLVIETANTEIDAAFCRRHPYATPGCYTMLAMSDTGCGMTPEVMQHLFEPFFTTKERGKGTGLGLSMIYGIVKQNNGFINVYSELNQGTSFKIYLPAVAVTSDQPPAPDPHDLPPGSETILLVEDEEVVRGMVRQILEDHGYRVWLATTAEEAQALAFAAEPPLDLLFTDVVLPTLNGRQLFESLQVKWPALRVLYMSGYTENAIAHHGVVDEGVMFLQKPFSIASLLRKVREALERKP